jgi:hypothetical protein
MTFAEVSRYTTSDWLRVSPKMRLFWVILQSIIAIQFIIIFIYSIDPHGNCQWM